jgi:hypothetical protein
MTIDGRDFRLYLGLCDFVNVTAIWWADTTAQDGSATLLGAAICEASGGDYDEATCTVLNTITGTDVNHIVNIPRGAYEMSAVYRRNTNDFWGAAAFVGKWYGDIEYPISVDALAQTITPGFQRVRVVPGSYTGLVHVHSAAIEGSSGTHQAGCVFYLSI